jgi:Signal transduction histidine kinase
MKKLKIKFIIIASVSFFIVLIAVLGLVNFISYKNVNSEIYATLRIITDNRGLPDFTNNKYKKYDDLFLTPETIYETRYFIVEYNSEMTQISLNTDNIAALDNEDITELIDKVINDDNKEGMLRRDLLRYAYLKTKMPNGNTVIAFMDCTRRMYSVRNTMRFSIYVGIISMLLLILLLSFFSRKAVAPILKNMESQKQFITNASHELKTPLAVISANAEVIEMTNGKSEWTDSIRNQVTHMSELVSQLIVLSKLQEHDDIELTEVNFSEKAADVAKSFKTVAEAAGKSFDSIITPDVKILADERGSRELISILVDNAVKYCDEGGSVNMSLTSRGKKAILTVSNDYKAGEGVDYSRFFERFYRADESHNNATKGYGIGLSMAESLVEMFNGRIGVNYKNKVITFTVIL